MIAGPYRILLAGLCIAGGGLALRCAHAATLQGADAAPKTALQAIDAPRLAAAQARGRFLGAGSCAAAACHGGAVGRDPKGSEYSVWIQSDRHADAYTTLFSRRSQQIVGKLGLKAAHTEETCLKCHSLTADAGETAPGRVSVPADGVSCEACHGPGEHWLEPHKRYAWKNVPSDQKLLLGFNDTKSILARTKACLGCHVGSEGRDVNHDLIAAGHPRLYFEMSAYLAKLPPHWDRAKDRQRHPALEAKLWAVGQLATADAALGLLEHRSAPKSHAPWPEFAEYACFACHHDLAAPNWRQQLDSTGQRGLYQWGTWNFALVEGLVRTRDGDAAAEALQTDLCGLKEKMAKPFPLQGAVAEQAQRMRAGFRRLAEQVDGARFNADEVQRLLDFLIRDCAPDATRDWETSTQLYLALDAIAKAQRELSAPAGGPALKPETLAKLREIRDLLRFPANDCKFHFLSPRDFDPMQGGDNLPQKMQQLRAIIKDK